MERERRRENNRLNQLKTAKNQYDSDFYSAQRNMEQQFLQFIQIVLKCENISRSHDCQKLFERYNCSFTTTLTEKNEKPNQNGKKSVIEDEGKFSVNEKRSIEQYE